MWTSALDVQRHQPSPAADSDSDDDDDDVALEAYRQMSPDFSESHFHRTLQTSLERYDARFIPRNTG